MKRRHFLLGTVGVAGALGVGWLAAPLPSRLLPGSPLALGPGEIALNGWVKVGSDNTITVMMSQAEMGQGVYTGLAMLLAEEMDAPWGMVRVAQAPLDPIYNNQAVIDDALPFTPEDHSVARAVTQHAIRRVLGAVPGLAGTGGSASVRDQWLPLRQAGASARGMLIAAAAQAWGVSAAQCATQAGRVLHPGGDRSASYGELASQAARMPLPRDPPLKDPALYRLVGHPVPRLDTPGKVNGSAKFAIDARPAGLLYAALRLCPTVSGKVAKLDAQQAMRLPGVRKVVVLEPAGGGLVTCGSTAGGVAVVADSSWNARRALETLHVEWQHGAAATLSDATIVADLEQALRPPDAGHARVVRGDVDAALRAATRQVTAQYRVPLLAHATMEPMNATVQFRDGVASVWAPTQAAGLARAAIAKQLGISTAKVHVQVPYLGGGFGRRYAVDYLTQAAAVARETAGAPVQLLWPREQDMGHDYYRPAFVAHCAAGLDAAGHLTAWKMTTAGSSLGAPSLADGAPAGAWDTAYDFPIARIAHRAVEHAVPVGIWRSVGHSYNAFFVESFIDEIAAAARRDPLQLRRELLAHDIRHLAVLDRLMRMSGGLATPALYLRARGMALHRSFGSIVGQMAEVSLTPRREIRVERVWCVVDCGVAVNPNLIRAQIEGGIMFGLSAALLGEITLKNGQVQQSNFHDYPVLRMSQSPRIEVEILAGAAEPGGIGEVGTPPIAPAVANAIFALTGQRLRRLPLRLDT